MWVNVFFHDWVSGETVRKIANEIVIRYSESNHVHLGRVSEITKAMSIDGDEEVLMELLSYKEVKSHWIEPPEGKTPPANE